MTSQKSAFQTLGKCYYYSLALNTLAIITIGIYLFILQNAHSIKAYEVISGILESYSLLFIFLTFYLSLCMVLNLIAALCFNHTKNPTIIFLVVFANFFCFPFGTLISAFTLYILRKLNRSFH